LRPLKNEEAPLVLGRGFWVRCWPVFDQRARVSGSPLGFFVLIVRLMIVISMGARYRTARAL
jgi:hypothetical protein